MPHNIECLHSLSISGIILGPSPNLPDTPQPGFLSISQLSPQTRATIRKFYTSCNIFSESQAMSRLHSGEPLLHLTHPTTTHFSRNRFAVPLTSCKVPRLKKYFWQYFRAFKIDIQWASIIHDLSSPAANNNEQGFINGQN